MKFKFKLTYLSELIKKATKYQFHSELFLGNFGIFLGAKNLTVQNLKNWFLHGKYTNVNLIACIEGNVCYHQIFKFLLQNVYFQTESYLTLHRVRIEINKFQAINVWFYFNFVMSESIAWCILNINWVYGNIMYLVQYVSRTYCLKHWRF